VAAPKAIATGTTLTLNRSRRQTKRFYSLLAIKPPVNYARSADGVSLAFTVAGSGPALVVVPWVPFSNIRMEWENPLLRAMYEKLERRLTVIQYDGRGTGHSQRDVRDVSLAAMVADLEAVVDRTGQKTISLFAQYNACTNALAFAAKHPDRVKRIVVFGGAARAWDAMSAGQTQALLSLIEQDWDLFTESAALQWMGWSAGDAGRSTAEAIRLAVTPQIARATMQAASAADVTHQLSSVSAPTLVLHRRGMTQIPLEISRSLAKGLPHGHLVVLEGTHAALFAEDADATVSMLGDFFCDGKEPAASAMLDAEPSRAAGHSQTGSGLSPREIEVLRLLASGESNGEIAQRLGITTNTIERHVANIYRKIDARGRADATAYALRHGLG
jgi:DNA-binding CsgD family transcriptional regulator/pimeloyl-ACP methyl ester carboxylesterase